MRYNDAMQGLTEVRTYLVVFALCAWTAWKQEVAISPGCPSQVMKNRITKSITRMRAVTMFVEQGVWGGVVSMFVRELSQDYGYDALRG